METEKETLLLMNHSTMTYDSLKEPEKIKQILHTLETHISKKFNQNFQITPLFLPSKYNV